MNEGSRKRVGQTLIIIGFVIWGIGAVLYLGNITGLWPTIPYAGFVTASLGAFSEAVGWAVYRNEPLVGAIEKRPTSLVVVVPALLLFSILLLAAALMFGGNLEDGASAGRWIGSTIFLLMSLGIVSALLKDLLSRGSQRNRQG